jgi:RimJ/RimL family protein N-acetyltransferase
VKLCFETDRLQFDPLSLDDLDLTVEQFGDPEIVKHVADRTYTEAELIEELPLYIRRAGDGCIGIWRLTEKATGDKIGTAILLPMPIEKDDTDWGLLDGGDISDGDIEVDYILKRSAWGKGFATEACTRMLRFAFEATPLDVVVACTATDNTASQHVLTKCGMKLLGTIRAYQEDTPAFASRKMNGAACEAMAFPDNPCHN